jgi:ABC-type Fe3+-hydroxamate transport system substrate-binding protein
MDRTTSLTDALGRQIALKGPPTRLVSLVPSLTEWLFSVGAGGRVVGITDYCSEPAPVLAGIARVGGTKNPDRARIAALRPDLVIVDQEENRERDVLALSAAGIPVYVTAIRRVADVPAQLSPLALALGLAATAAPGLAAISAAQQEAAQAVTQRRPTLAFIWRDPWMAIGADTYADDLLRLCGAANLGCGLAGRYPRAPLATFMALQPELILLPSEPYAFSAPDREAFAAFADAPAVRNGRILLCDGMALTWPGPRTVAALQYFRELIG